MKFKKILSLAVSTILAATIIGCGGSNTSSSSATPPPAPPADSQQSTPEQPPTDTTPDHSNFKVAMVTDVGGVNDQSFNQSSWEGLQAFRDSHGVQIKFLESKQEADFGVNLDNLADEDTDLIWGVGFLMGDAVLNSARQNPHLLYGIIDYAYDPSDGDNLVGVLFKAEQPSFLVGYVAAHTTETDRIGFIGGIKGNIIDQFEYGYRAGVAYAEKELGKEIIVDIQYADSFSDDTRGKAIASQMYTAGADVVFHAAGNVGLGLFEAAKEFDRYAIGVDRDQSSAAPEHILTSAMKNVGRAMYLVSEEIIINGKAAEMGGTTVTYGLSEGGVGIPEVSLVAPEIKAATRDIEALLVDGTLVAPATEQEYEAFLAQLQ